MKKVIRSIATMIALGGLSILSGCQGLKLLNPAGYIAHEERFMLIICVAVMLCVVIPVMIAVVWFAFKYRAGNKSSEYLPDWGKSHKVETFMWGIPVVVIIVLASLTGYYTFKLEPSQVLPRSVVGQTTPLQVDVVALDWKWLFIYPEYGVASVNELYAPKGRQVFLQISAENSINAFWVPRLGTILYAMPQMNAKLHLIADRLGDFEGLSANFSGDGFSGMHFKWHSVTEEGFRDWIKAIKAAHTPKLDRAGYLKLAQHPSEEAPVAEKVADQRIRYYSDVDPELYYRIVNACVVSDRECNERLMWRDAASSLWGQLCSVFNADYKVVN